MRTALIGAVLAFSANSVAVASQPTEPGPEARKLGYYVGSWVGHGETKGGPLGKAGHLSSRQTCKWLSGGFQVLCQGEERGPSGRRQFLNVLAYDEDTKAYTEYSVSSFGEAEYDQGGTLVGNTLAFVVDHDDGGKMAKFRYAETHVSPTRYSYRAEVSVGGGKWAQLADGEIVKVR